MTGCQLKPTTSVELGTVTRCSVGGHSPLVVRNAVLQLDATECAPVLDRVTADDDDRERLHHVSAEYAQAGVAGAITAAPAFAGPQAVSLRELTRRGAYRPPLR